jgi:hypothetical protein
MKIANKPKERRNVGRARLGWPKDVENYLRELEKKKYRQKVINREEWLSYHRPMFLPDHRVQKQANKLYA